MMDGTLLVPGVLEGNDWTCLPDSRIIPTRTLYMNLRLQRGTWSPAVKTRKTLSRNGVTQEKNQCYLAGQGPEAAGGRREKAAPLSQWMPVKSPSRAGKDQPHLSVGATPSTTQHSPGEGKSPPEPAPRGQRSPLSHTLHSYTPFLP